MYGVVHSSALALWTPALDHRQYRFQNGLETGSRARIKSTQTVQDCPCCAVANAVLALAAYSVEVWG